MGAGPFGSGGQAGEEAGVIEVGVGDDHGAQRLRREGERDPVPLLQLLVPLVEAAVDEGRVLSPGKMGATSRHDTACPIEGYVRHDPSLSSRRVYPGPPGA